MEILSPYVAEILVYGPVWTPGCKTDAIDAHSLAEKIRTGTVGRPVYKDPKLFTALREYARIYTMVTRDVARTKNRLKSLIQGRGIPCSGEAVYSRRGREALTRQLPQATAIAAEILGQEIDRLLEIKKEAEKTMLRESHRHKISKILETAPGLGAIRVAQMIPVVITPHRFRTTRMFWSYCGFGVVVRSSSDWIRRDDQWVRGKLDHTRGLNREFNHMLNGTKPTLAKVTIARKIAALVLAMWKREERCQPEMYRLSLYFWRGASNPIRIYSIQVKIYGKLRNMRNPRLAEDLGLRP